MVQIAPAVRAAGRVLGIEREAAHRQSAGCSLHKIGFDYIVDTNFSADLTIMEEGANFSRD
jgi:NADH-quinone oxidoreductase subunit G